MIVKLLPFALVALLTWSDHRRFPRADWRVHLMVNMILVTIGTLFIRIAVGGMQ